MYSCIELSVTKMKFQICISWILVLLYVTKIHSFKFVNCGNKDAIFQNISMKLSPDPIKLSQTLTVSLYGKLVQDVPEDAIAVYDINRNTWLTDFHIPCFQDKYGSCTMKFCNFLDLFWGQLKDFFPPGRPTKCPVKKGIYQGSNIKVKLPDLGSVGNLFAGGEYWGKIQILEKPGGKQLACLELTASID